MTFKEEVHILINNFIKCNNYPPNELHLGRKETDELYSNDSCPTLEILDEINETEQFMGLKLKIFKTKTFMKVDYNPHYD